jgi:DNA-binding CsgD family transcriptional regulator
MRIAAFTAPTYACRTVRFHDEGAEMRGGRPMLEREAELAALSAAAAEAAAGRGTVVLVEGPAGIGKTTLLRAACARAQEAGWRVLTARGLALESDFPYGVVRQVFEPVRAAAPYGEWAQLLDGAAGLSARVFDWAEVASVEEDVPHATVHGLYWLIANVAAQRRLVIAVDDAHWADPPSLRWVAHLASRLDGLPVLLLLAVRSGPATSATILLEELRSGESCQLLRPAPLSAGTAAVLVRERLGPTTAAELCQACHVSTGGNPFLLEALVAALRAEGTPAGNEAVSLVNRLGPEPVARAVLRRVGQLGEGAEALTRAVAVLGGPALLRQAAELAGQDLEVAGRLADGLRAIDVLAQGPVLDFGHPVVRSAVYQSIPAGERALAHRRAARLLERGRADTDRVALHLLRSEPGGSAVTVALLRTAAKAASGRGAPDTAAGYLRRALDEPPDPATRPAVLLELGLALAGERRAAAPSALREAVELTSKGKDRAMAAMLSARTLGIWGHHDAVIAVCRDALTASAGLDQATAHGVEAELVANAWLNPATSADARTRTQRHPTLAADSHARAADGQARAAGSQWRINSAWSATASAQPSGNALALLAPVLAAQMADVPPDSLAAVYSLLILIFNDELSEAGKICETALALARSRGSLSMVAHASCIRSMISRRCGELEDAAAEARLALDFKLGTSPPLAIAWAAAFCIEALAGLGRLEDAETIAGATEARQPPAGYLHTLMFLQARGGLRTAQGRFAEALDDLRTAGEGWRRLGVAHPAIASWRTEAAAAHSALGRPQEAASLAAEQIALARRVGTPRTLGIALRTCAATAGRDQAEECLIEAVRLLEATPARLDLAQALTDLGSLLRKSGRRTDARSPLHRALDLAHRAGAAPLAERARAELIAAGARPRRTALTGPDALTSAERRVTALAASGLGNRQIAQQLFITLPTVETHLRHAYHKLGISSRAGLTDRLSLQPDPRRLPSPRPDHRPAEVS